MSQPHIAAAYSPAIQDYLKACYRLMQSECGSVAVSQLAETLRVAPPSVTNMMKRLEGMKLVRRTSDARVQLTKSGEAVALEVIRHHRLLETFLIQELGMEWAEAHQEAEVLEHYISERLEHLIDQRLERPRSDPHGEPIPRKDGTIALVRHRPLLSQPINTPLVIQQVATQDTALLQYLQDHDLTPGATVRIREVAPFNGPLALEVGRQCHHISREVAQCIYASVKS